MTDEWRESDSYERYMGRWSREIARLFVDWLAVPPAASWLDVGCGTGALSSAVVEAALPRSVSGIDPAAGFIAEARNRLGPAADLRVGDAQQLGFPDDHFDAVASGIALNFVPDPLRAVSEMRRVTRPGGTTAAYLWDYAGGMEMIRLFWDAATELDPDAATLDEATRFPVCREGRLAALFEQAGLTDVSATSLVTTTRFVGWDDFWQPFLGGQGPAPTYLMGLTPHDRARLEAHMKSTVPMTKDGSILLSAAAWAVKGGSDA